MADEKLYADLYRVLHDLKYPDVLTKHSNDTKTLLKGKNRIKLLIWIIQLYPPFNNISFDNLNAVNLKNQLIKYYKQLGLCLNAEILMGDGPMKKQCEFLSRLICLIKTLSNLKNNPIKKSVETNAMDIYNNFVTKTDALLSSLELDHNQDCITSNECYNLDIQNKTDNAVNSTNDDPIDEQDNKNLLEIFQQTLEKFNEAYSNMEITVAQNTDVLYENQKVLDKHISSICNNFEIFSKVIDQSTSLKETIHNNIINNTDIMDNIKKYDVLLENSLVETTKVCNSYDEL